MKKLRRNRFAPFAAACALALVASVTTPAFAEDGVTDTEILLGGSHPFSGPASAYGAVGKGAEAYFAYVNDHGGVNGRKITYKDLDDGYSPPQAVQIVRGLVEQDKVFAIFDTLGTGVNLAIRPYLNQNSIPQLFIATGASTWAHDYKTYPWTIGFQPDYQSEAIVYAQYILKEKPKAKVGIIYQNDDFGQDYLTGFKIGLGSHADMIVKAVSYEVTDPDVSSQIANLKASGADAIFICATPKFATQSLVAIGQQSWKPLVLLTNVSASQSVLRAAAKAGATSAVEGLVTALYNKDPADPKWANDPGMKLYKEAMAKYAPGADASNAIYAAGFGIAYTMVDVLKASGRQLTRAKLMQQVNHLNESDNPMALPGILVKTTPTNHFVMTQMQLASYQGGEYKAFGGLIDARPFIKEEKPAE